MKTYLSTLFGLLFSLLQPINAQEIEPAEQSQFALKVMSFNIRYNNPNDGEHAWPNRKNRVASVIRFHGADLIGMQEALGSQSRAFVGHMCHEISCCQLLDHLCD